MSQVMLGLLRELAQATANMVAEVNRLSAALAKAAE